VHDSELTFFVVDSSKTLVGQAAGLDKILRQLRDMAGVFPSGHEGGSGSEGSITERAGVQNIEGRTGDPARAARARLEVVYRRVHELVMEANSIHQQWTGAHAALAAANPDQPRCELCWRIQKDCPVDRVSHVKRNLQRDYKLCEWCYRHILRTGKKPTNAELEAHRDGRKARCACTDEVVILAS
jgi:hypothetical protein